MDAFDKKRQLDEIDRLIRTGKLQQATSLLQEICSNPIQGSLRKKAAELCLRTGLYLVGLKVISPSVIDENGEIWSSAKAEDICEYSILLQKLGMAEEAIEKINACKNLTTKPPPKALLYLAICHFSLWDYEAAIPYLRLYCQHPDLSDYQKQIGRVNLLSALTVTERLNEAEELQRELQPSLEEANLRTLNANCLEIKALIQIKKNDILGAEKNLQSALALLEAESQRSQIFIEKWFSYVNAVKENSVIPLEKFKRRAFAAGFWEGVRDADFLSLKIQFNEEVFKRLVYGTDLRCFQERVLKEMGRPWPAEPTTQFGPDSDQIFDTYRGTLNGNTIFETGRKVHHLLHAISYDLYRPAGVGKLFARVFRDESFNVFSSPNKLYQLVNRLRADLKTKDLPVSIEKLDSGYKLRFLKPVRLVGYLYKEVPKREDLTFNQIFAHAGKASLSRQEIVSFLQQPEATCSRLLKKAVENNVLEKSGNGRKTVYRLGSGTRASVVPCQ